MGRSLKDILERRRKRISHSNEILIGVVVAPHGLKGEVKVKPLSDIFERQLNYASSVNYYRGLTKRKLEVEGLRRSGNLFILKFKGVNDRNGSEALVGGELWLEKEKSAPLEEGEYLFEDLKGCRVFNPEGKELGLVVDVLEMPSSHILVIESDGKEVLVPFIDEFVKEVNVKDKKIVIVPIEGMF
jgi:16S rRNA processing protein RimM